MSSHAARVLEFDRLLGLLAGRTVSPPGGDKARLLRPGLTRVEVLASLAEIEELRRLRASGQGAPALGDLSDLQPLLLKLQPHGTFLAAGELLQVSLCLQLVGTTKQRLQESELTPLWQEQSQKLDPLKDLARQLKLAIGPRGDILDSASAEIASLRRELRQTRSLLQSRLERMLSDERLAPAFQEQLITTRNDRYVLPVRADRRGLIKGFVQDESASGQTLYVEPVAVLDLNNNLRRQQRAEQHECDKILQQLSDRIRQHSVTLLANQELLARLDLQMAAARLADEMGAQPPRLLDTPGIDLRQARHPLLLFDQENRKCNRTAVPIDLKLGQKDRALLISGPNTGGKTVALKTAGLLQLMLAAGLPLPCAEGSQTYLFSEIFADIGDEQSIAEKLSTFSAHLSNIREILKVSGPDSLVLLDELGTGTDPAEGGALGIAILERLAKNGARTMATSHLSMIKGAAQLRDGMINAAVEFDAETLAPTYRLHYGIPGASGALSIARRLNLPEDVLSSAEKLIDPQQQRGEGLLQELTEMQRRARLDLEKAERLRKEAGQERNRRRDLLQEFEQQRQTLLDKARRKADGLVRQTETELKNLLADARQEADKLPARAELTRRLREVGSDCREEPPADSLPAARDLVPGELVRHRRLGSIGEVTKVTGREVDLLLGNTRLRCRIDDLAHQNPRQFRSPQGQARISSQPADETFEPRLLLIGARADEACCKLDQFIDQAMRLHLNEVEVVHGAGEGILRRTVREFLRDHRGVSAFHAADIPYGGDNVTIVRLAG